MWVLVAEYVVGCDQYCFHDELNHAMVSGRSRCLLALTLLNCGWCRPFGKQVTSVFGRGIFSESGTSFPPFHYECKLTQIDDRLSPPILNISLEAPSIRGMHLLCPSISTTRCPFFFPDSLMNESKVAVSFVFAGFNIANIIGESGTDASLPTAQCVG